MRMAALLILSFLCLPGAAAEGERGRILYEARCIACHNASVHSRDPRQARDFDGIRAQVRRWSGETGAGWSREEIDEVTVYLNRRYYRYDCPALLCGREQAAIGR